jgi:hypothetical protein
VPVDTPVQQQHWQRIWREANVIILHPKDAYQVCQLLLHDFDEKFECYESKNFTLQSPKHRFPQLCLSDRIVLPISDSRIHKSHIRSGLIQFPRNVASTSCFNNLHEPAVAPDHNWATAKRLHVHRLCNPARNRLAVPRQG